MTKTKKFMVFNFALNQTSSLKNKSKFNLIKNNKVAKF